LILLDHHTSCHDIKSTAAERPSAGAYLACSTSVEAVEARRDDMPRLVIDELEVDVQHSDALALADYLWRGLDSGSITSAARLTEALHRDAKHDTKPIIFQSYEVAAVRNALTFHGLVDDND
jgi:hypothetical protein